ncbi:tRNA wybutosine-synthesizing protein 3 homolog [Eurytemora carolleeae]|uniref:tRNA wybutosine-synthesizing protein 3 homolog n=1 Tax=Eurytemora carolleeae TaxID=1294199 RepID=UPI000C7611FD|nr:tRNA wybutosine-synthesizing protein 3 homolog [Eurytemora carolleeae]|eukprot:XP_023340059.1 tRNA wybutosine-synthesizing protein 3 homolog [Eurytemora affinis]
MSTLFDRQKADCFSKIDLSRKGSIDDPIVDIIKHLNNHQDFFSLSSCSGRIVVFAEGDRTDNKEELKIIDNKELKTSDKDIDEDKLSIVKSGCDWIHVSHTLVNPAEIIPKIKERFGQSGCVVIKFEPFILHVQCRDINAAKLVHLTAVESGFRNSGITVGRAGKFVSAVRSTHGLEVPVTTEEGELLVSEQYIQFILNKANSKLKENFSRIEKFYEKLGEFLSEEKKGTGKQRKKDLRKEERIAKDRKKVEEKEIIENKTESSLTALEDLFV